MSDELGVGQADIHHPKGPLTAELAAQQPLSRDDSAPRVCDALCRDVEEDRDRLAADIERLRRELDTMTEVARGNKRHIKYLTEECERLTAEVARVRADERRRALDEALDLIAQHAVGVSARDPFLADTLDSERLTFGQVRAALIAGWETAAAPAERVQDGSTDTTATPDPQRYWWQHDDCDSGPVAGAADWPGRPCAGCGMSLGGWTRGAPITAGSVPSLPEETPDAR